MIEASEIENPHDVDLELRLNQEVKQEDNTKNMHYKIWDQLEYISKHICLEPGDILITGTPEGNGPVEEGDLLQASLKYQGKELAKIQDTIRQAK